MVDFGIDDLTHFVLVLLEDVFLLVLADLGLKVLAQGEDIAAAEAFDLQDLGDVVAHFEVRLDANGIGKLDLAQRVLQFVIVNHGAVVIDLEVTLIDIHNDVDKVLRIGIELLV